MIPNVLFNNGSRTKDLRVDILEGTLICCECSKVIVAPDDIHALSATADNDRVVCSSCYQMYTCGGG